MPCRDYDSDNSSYELTKLKERTDMLARIACKALTAMEKMGNADFLLLKDEEVRIWWEQHKIDDAKAAAKRAEARRIAQAKQTALAKLTDEEKKLLGIK